MLRRFIFGVPICRISVNVLFICCWLVYYPGLQVFTGSPYTPAWLICQTAGIICISYYMQKLHSGLAMERIKIRSERGSYGSDCSCPS